MKIRDRKECAYWLNTAKRQIGNLSHRQNVSFRTSARTGVGISIEFRAAYRHTDRSFLCCFPESTCVLSRNGTPIREIATPVCGLVRNDREFDKFQFSCLLLSSGKGIFCLPVTEKTPGRISCRAEHQISMITGRIMGLRLVVLKRYPLMSFLMADLMAAQSRTRLRWQRSIASKATCRSSVIRSSDSFT